MIDRRLFLNIDWLLLSVTLLLALSGLASIYSTTYTQGTYIYHRQIYWMATGALVMPVIIALNYSLLERFAYPIFALSVLVLAITLVLGRSVGGAQRWLSLGFISFQPSEFAKIAFIVVLARYFSSRYIPRKGLDLKGLIIPATLLLVPFLLVAKAPDLGTALIFFLIFCSMLSAVRVRLKTMVGLVIALSPAVPLAWMSLKKYQKARLLGFLDPAQDPLGSGYHILQSKIAIGSGGLMGKGFTKGTQGSLMFLPEHHTDFIFPIVAEEWGVIGSLTLLALFLTLILRGLNTAKNSKDRFGLLLAFGISSMFFWHIIINIGMASGLLPVVGVPLPFLSYGGSFLVTSLISVAILVNISMRRFIF
jgi:rod shape determining protein RodA